jgi:hypothetical protein
MIDLSRSHNAVLQQTIDTYVARFAENAARYDFASSHNLLDEFHAVLRVQPPELTEVIWYFDVLVAGEKLTGHTLAFAAAWHCLVPELCDPLVAVLSCDRCSDFHEPAVELLEALCDERAVPALAMAVTYRWDYDQWLSVPRKALQALGSIGTLRAIQVVRAALSAPEETIRDSAREVLAFVERS